MDQHLSDFENRSMSKVKLAKCIGTSDAYIRQVENQGYKPPTFDLCEKISLELSLTNNEKLELYEAAFIERIESEKEFYSLLKNSIFSSSNLPSSASTNVITARLKLRQTVKEDLSSISYDVERIFFDYFQKSNISIDNIVINQSSVTLNIMDQEATTVEANLPNIMKLISSKIKSDFPNFAVAPSIWDSNFEVIKISETAQARTDNHELSRV